MEHVHLRFFMRSTISITTISEQIFHLRIYRSTERIRATRDETVEGDISFSNTETLFHFLTLHMGESRHSLLTYAAERGINHEAAGVRCRNVICSSIESYDSM